MKNGKFWLKNFPEKPRKSPENDDVKEKKVENAISFEFFHLKYKSYDDENVQKKSSINYANNKEKFIQLSQKLRTQGEKQCRKTNKNGKFSGKKILRENGSIDFNKKI